MVTLFIIALILALIVYVSKRRFGMICLGLVAGSIIATNWAIYLTSLLQSQGLRLISPPLEAVVGIILILLPALLLLMVGPKYHNRIGRLLGSLITGLLALALMIAQGVEDTSSTLPLLANINYFQAIIVGVAIVAALGDILYAHFSGKRSSH